MLTSFQLEGKMKTTNPFESLKISRRVEKLFCRRHNLALMTVEAWVWEREEWVWDFCDTSQWVVAVVNVASFAKPICSLSTDLVSITSPTQEKRKKVDRSRLCRRLKLSQKLGKVADIGSELGGGRRKWAMIKKKLFFPILQCNKWSAQRAKNKSNGRKLYRFVHNQSEKSLWF